jgi:hypothetical protein
MYSPGPSRPQQATETRPIRNIQDRKKDLGILPYILMYGKLLKGFSAVPISADIYPRDASLISFSAVNSQTCALSSLIYP